MGPFTHLTHPLRRCLIAVVACVAMACAVAPAESQAQLHDMGHRAIATDGPRPLLTIMADFSDQRFDIAPTRHDAPVLRRPAVRNGRSAGASLGGPGGFFDDNSNGGFTFTPAAIPGTVPAGYRAGGILGPYTQSDNPATAVDESTYAGWAPPHRGRAAG